MDPLNLTLPDLVAAAALLLSQTDLPQKSGRVSEVPSLRTVRYYAKHGLIPAPRAWQGRAAIYGATHLLGLVAIKRLQSRGMTLEEVYTKVAGADLKTLETLSGISAQDVTVLLGLSPGSSAQAQQEEEEPEFWRRVPEPVPPRALALAQRSGGAKEIRGVRLGPGLLLVMEEAARELDDDDRAAIQAASGPLVRLLYARNLVHEDD